MAHRGEVKRRFELTGEITIQPAAEAGPTPGEVAGFL
jgi:hypothetical protein